MEINLENAFFMALKLSISPFKSSFDVATQKIQELIQRLVIKILDEPLLSTFIISCFLILLISVITISTLITAGVLCLIIVILLIEGFVLSMVISLAAAITASSFVIVGLISTFKMKLFNQANISIKR